MSDLLGNLVSKTLNLSPAIEPRPVSRFEPWQPMGVAEAGPLDSTLKMDVHSVAAPAQHAEPLLDLPRVAPRHSAEDTPPDRLAPSSQVTERIEHVIVERNVRDSRPSDQHERASNAQHTVTPPLISTEHASRPEPPTIIERIERLIVDRDQPPLGAPTITADRMRPRPMIETVGQSADQSAVHTVEGPLPTKQSSGERPPTDRTSDAPTVIVQSIAVPPALDVAHEKHPRPVPIVERLRAPTVTTQSARSDNTLSQRSMPPTIRVSIGRVEVRATLPLAPVKRVSPPTSTTSLDDYLRRRRAGDRR